MLRWIAIWLIAVPTLAIADDWQTDYEKSGFKRTPTYDETVVFCKRLAQASPFIEYTTFGVSPQGRDLPLLIVNTDGRFTPEAVRESDHVVFLIQAGIHSGEIDGKDAGLMLIRDIVIREEALQLLDHVTLLFMPIFSVDGHERSSPYNRANQNGPENMGWRATATNLNLNRDYLKADAPEMQAWLRLYREWLPEFFADCHVTDGADYQYVVTYALEVFGNMDPELTGWVRDRYLPRLSQTLKDDGYPIIRYNSYKTRHEPKSGLVSWASPPRFSTGYAALQNRPAILVETHMLKDYRTRVSGTYALLRRSLEILGEQHGALREMVLRADARSASRELRSEPFPLAFEADSTFTPIDFLGVEYEVLESDLTGGPWHVYTDKKVTYQVPYYNRQHPTILVDLPEAYVIPPQWQEVIARIELHGIKTARLAEPTTIDVSSYRFTAPDWADTPYEGRHTLSFEQMPITESRAYPAGSVIVHMNQRGARVAAHLLEPKAPDSFVFWGFFDTIFEQKEYIESYVIESLAREMLEEDPKLREEFEAMKESNPDFAKNPDWIRQWFYQRSVYWDDLIGVYPVGRVMDRELAESLIEM